MIEELRAREPDQPEAVGPVVAAPGRERLERRGEPIEVGRGRLEQVGLGRDEMSLLSRRRPAAPASRAAATRRGSSGSVVAVASGEVMLGCS